MSPAAAAALSDPGNELYLSIASLWEATIKIALSKLQVPGQNIEFLLRHLNSSGVQVLPILPAHLLALQSLPLLHRDPFDRILMAQSIAERMPLVTLDTAIRAYGTDVLW